MNFARYADDAAAGWCTNYFVVGRRKYTCKGMPAARPDTSTARGVREPKSMVYVALVCEAKGPCTAVVIYIIVQRLKLRDKQKKNLRGVVGDGFPHYRPPYHACTCLFVLFPLKEPRFRVDCFCFFSSTAPAAASFSGVVLVVCFGYPPLFRPANNTTTSDGPPLCYSGSLLPMFYLVLLFSSWRQCSGTRRGCGEARA